MKQPGDVYTLDLIDKPKRGRPRKPDAMTDAQRAREYRARKRAGAKPTPPATPLPKGGAAWWLDAGNDVGPDGKTAYERAAL